MNLTAFCSVLPLLSGISSPSSTFSLPRLYLPLSCDPVLCSSLSILSTLSPPRTPWLCCLGLFRWPSTAPVLLRTGSSSPFPKDCSVTLSQQKLVFSLYTVPGTFSNRDFPSILNGSQSEECEESGLLCYPPNYAH